MYLYLEGDKIIPEKDVIVILSYKEMTDDRNRDFWEEEKRKKEVVFLCEKEERSVVITDEKIYVSSYGLETLMRRAKEFFSIVGGI